MASGWKWAVWKPEARSFLRVFHLVVGAQVLGRFPLLSQVISRVLDWKSIIGRLQLVPIWDAGAAGGSFIHYITVPNPPPPAISLLICLRRQQKMAQEFTFEQKERCDQCGGVAS